MYIIENWNWIEPIMGTIQFIGFLTGIFALCVYYIRHALAKRRRASSGKEEIWVVLQVGVSAVETAAKQFDMVPDHVIDPKVSLGHLAIDGVRDYKLIVKEYKKILDNNQDKKINLVTSGMTGLNFLLGQISFHHDIDVYQWDFTTKNYKLLPDILDLIS